MPAEFLVDSGGIEAATVIWAAGVVASPAATWIDAEHDRAGRFKVNADLSVPGRPEIFAVGDTAVVTDRQGRPVPGIAPAAKQMGRYVGEPGMSGPFFIASVHASFWRIPGGVLPRVSSSIIGCEQDRAGTSRPVNCWRSAPANRTRAVPSIKYPTPRGAPLVAGSGVAI